MCASAVIDERLERINSSAAGGRLMDWITPNIGIGSVHDVRDAAALRRNGVRPVLALIDDGASTTAADLGLVRDRGRSAR